MKTKLTDKNVKILLVYKDFDGNAQVESVWGERVGNNYKIINVPFFASSIAYGDIVKVEESDGVLYFDEIVSASNHSTIQMIIFNPDELERVGADLVRLGCDWEGSHLKGYISVDIPDTVLYENVKKYLEEGQNKKRWDYKEACLSIIHSR